MELKKGAQLYEGKAKKVYETDDPDVRNRFLQG